MVYDRRHMSEAGWMSSPHGQPPSVEAWRNIELGPPLGEGSRNPVYRARYGTSDLVVRASGRSEASLAWELDLGTDLNGNAQRPQSSWFTK